MSCVHPRNRRGRSLLATACAAVALLAFTPSPAHALEKMCDSSYENCRTELLNLIKAEKVGIDVGMWFMEDARYATELTYRRGVSVLLFSPNHNPDRSRFAQGRLQNQLAALI